MKHIKGFTITELMIVIFIVGILTAAIFPLIRGRIDAAKWSEARAAAGTIKTAVRAFVTITDPNYTDYGVIETSLGNKMLALLLGFTETSLDGSYFNQADYSISNVNGANGTCVVKVRSTHPQGPPGVGILNADGSWSVITGGVAVPTIAAEPNSIDDGKRGSLWWWP